MVTKNLFITLWMGEPSKSLESKITTLIHNIYRELYKNSIPTGDWDSLYKKYLGTEIRFWEKYHCPKKTKEKIILNYLKKEKILRKITKYNIKKYILNNY